MNNLVLKNGDNFNFVENNSVDFILTDPPFNISKETNFHTYEKNKIHSYKFDAKNQEAWDTYTHEEFLVKLDEWSKEWFRVLKKGGNFAIFCADAYISHLMDALKKNNLQPRRLIVWRKNNAVPVNRKHMPMSSNEYIVVGVKKGKSTFNSDIPIVKQSIDDKIIEATIIADKTATIIHSKIMKNVLSGISNENDHDKHIETIVETVSKTLSDSCSEISSKIKSMYKLDNNEMKYFQACIPNYVQFPLKTGNRIHPTEKPVDLLKYFVALYSNNGDTILDGFAGSGSTGVSALELGRNAILVERDKEFFGKIVNRFNNGNNLFQEYEIIIVE